MRVVISRKGFDSGAGGVPSPILPDGRMVSLPIPEKTSPILYGDITKQGVSIGDLVEGLTCGARPRGHGAHLDPDLDEGAIPRVSGWRPLFGQSGASLAHLQGEGVAPGDLFLFFGWFRPAERRDGRWRFVKGTRSIHAIWGWMCVGARHVCSDIPPDVSAWSAGHPHLVTPHPSPNELLVAAPSWRLGAKSFAGAGLFGSSPVRVLSAEGPGRSVWSLPEWMHPERNVASLSYHKDLSRWTVDDNGRCRLKTVARGQEFVLHTARQDLLAEWLATIFADVPAVDLRQT